MQNKGSDKNQRKTSVNNIRKAKISKKGLKDKKIENMNIGSINPKSSRKGKKLRNKFVIIVPVLLIVFTFIFIMADNLTKDTSNSSLDISSAISFFSEDEITPSPTPTSSPVSVTEVSRLERFTALQENISSFTKEFDGRIGIYYINLSNEETFGYEEKAPFVAASSIKLALVTQLYKAVSEGKYKLDENLTYDSRPYPTGDFEAGTGVVAKEPNGTKISVRRTAQLAITISDNCATNMVIHALGGIDAISPILNDISDEVPYRKEVKYTNYNGAIQSGRHRTSAYDLAMYTKHLHSLWKSDTLAYNPLMNDLQETVFTFGLQAKLPKDVKIAHKIGTNNEYRTENDVGIIFASEPYVLCVTTETELQEKGRDAVSQISLMFYEYIEGIK